MKQTRNLLNWLVACVVAVAMVTDASAADKARTGKVVRIKGQARYSTGNNVWQPLKLATELKPGAVIQTARGSFVDFVLSESAVPTPKAQITTMLSYQPVATQDIIRVTEDSVVAIDKLSAVDTGADTVTETQLDLRSGRILGTVKKMPAASRFEIKIPNGVAGIRGTIWSISADGVVSVFVGSLVIAYTKADGTVVTQLVTGGWRFDPRTGELTPISKGAEGEFGQWQQECGQYHRPPPRRPHDHTVHHVSTHGHGEHEGGIQSGGGGG